MTVDGKHHNQIVEGIRATLRALKDQLAVSRLDALRAVEPDVAKYLYESGRCAVAHAYSEPIVDPDDVSDLHRRAPRAFGPGWSRGSGAGFNMPRKQRNSVIPRVDPWLMRLNPARGAGGG